jgi:hypothetical protein
MACPTKEEPTRSTKEDTRSSKILVLFESVFELLVARSFFPARIPMDSAEIFEL